MTEDAHDSNNDIYLKAVDVGCKPIWSDGIVGKAWHCGCDNLAHALDQQCSVITLASLSRDPYKDLDELRDKLTAPSINEEELWKICDPNGFYKKS